MDQKLHGLEGKITESKSERKRLLKLIMKGGSDFPEEEMRELDGSVKEMEKDLVTLRSKRENLTRASDNFQKSRDEIATLIDRVQSSSEDSLLLRSALQNRIKDLCEKIEVRHGGDIVIGKGHRVSPPEGSRRFTVKFKNSGIVRTVVPATDDPTRLTVMVEENPTITFKGKHLNIGSKHPVVIIKDASDEV